MGCNNSKQIQSVQPAKIAHSTKIDEKSSIQRRSEVVISAGVAALKAQYDIDRRVFGSGHFGKVYKATNKADPSITVAIKVIDKRNLKSNDLQMIMTEIGILQELDHPNIVRYMETFEEPRFIYIVMESCSGGELFDSRDIILKNGKFFTERQTCQIIQKALSALNHCHKLNIIHRDIKPENLMFGKEGEIRIVDFGLAQESKKNIQQMAGTPYFMSPDVLNGSYGQKCDIWSLGCVLYMLVAGELPFDGTSRAEVFEKIKSGTYAEPMRCSKECRDLIQKMICVNVDKRYTAEQALHHPWFKILDDESSEAGKNQVKITGDVIKQLQKFKTQSSLHQAALQCLVKIVDTAETKQLRAEFERIDIDKSGLIDVDELQKAVAKFRTDISMTEVKSVVDRLDYDLNKQINYSEFIAATMDLQKLLTKEKLQAIFNQFDIDHSGNINFQDIKVAFTKFGRDLPDDEVHKILKQHDADQNEEIDLEEFKSMMLAITGSH